MCTSFNPIPPLDLFPKSKKLINPNLWQEKAQAFLVHLAIEKGLKTVLLKSPTQVKNKINLTYIPPCYISKSNCLSGTCLPEP